jgi:hypothetical protein
MLQRHGERFFRVKIGLTVDKRYDLEAGRPPAVDAARVVVASADPSASGTRLCFGRPATEDDRGAAEAAERLQRGSGMAALARRCGAVWLVATEPKGRHFEPEAGEDRVALTMAAVLASVFLGPILPPRGDGLYGVKTARLKLGA